MSSADIIGAVSFSRAFGYVEAGDDKGIFQRIQDTMASVAWLMHAGWLFRLHQCLRPIIGNWLKANDRNGYFHEFAVREVQGRKQRGGDSNDIIGQLLEMGRAKPQLNDTNISFMMTSNVFAGSDTTSIALRIIFLQLLRHPASMARLLLELQEKRSSGQLSDPVRFDESEAWPYLQAVMYESLRLHAPAGFILDRDVPQGGMTIKGIYVPEGVSVFMQGQLRAFKG